MLVCGFVMVAEQHPDALSTLTSFHWCINTFLYCISHNFSDCCLIFIFLRSTVHECHFSSIWIFQCILSFLWYKFTLLHSTRALFAKNINHNFQLSLKGILSSPAGTPALWAVFQHLILQHHTAEASRFRKAVLVYFKIDG